MTIGSDIDRDTADFAPDRLNKEHLSAYFRTRTPRQIEATRAVAMHKREPYLRAILASGPFVSSKKIDDRFRIRKQMTERGRLPNLREPKAQAI